MFLNKSVLLATITSVPVGINSIPGGTEVESLILAEFRYISSLHINTLTRPSLAYRTSTQHESPRITYGVIFGIIWSLVRGSGSNGLNFTCHSCSAVKNAGPDNFNTRGKYRLVRISRVLPQTRKGKVW